MATPVPDLIYGALAEIRVARGGDVVRAEDQALCLGFLNEILERLAVTPNALYAQTGVTQPLTPGLSPHTIGPTGTIVVPRRPARLRTVAIVVTPTTRTIIPIRSAAWADAQTQSLSGSIPAGVWYNRDWPDGALWFWPTPSLPSMVQIGMDLEVTAVALSDAIDLPPGYSELLRLWTAKKAAPSFAREFSAASQAALTECLGEVFGTNIDRVYDLDTRDGGVPRRRGGTYDYQTGLVD
jgi:hypothetical protein